jgi:hypothetical protein
MGEIKINYEQADLDAVTRVLMQTRVRWLKAPELAEASGVADRVIRNMAEFTGRFVSGNDGYCILERAEPGEIAHHINSLRSRAKHILARASRVERRAQLTNRI